MPHAYTEDQLVEQPAIGLFAELGWSTVPALEETFGATVTSLSVFSGELSATTFPETINEPDKRYVYRQHQT